MDAAVPRPLTKLTFRRDVRLFLAGLVGLLVVLVLVLVLLLGRAAGTVASEIQQRQQLAAAGAAASFNLMRQAPIDTRLTYARGTYDIDAIVYTAGGRTYTSGTAEGLVGIEQRVEEGTLVCYFDPSEADSLRKTFRAVTYICAAGAAACAALLLLYLPKITRPVEAMLDQALRVDAAGAHGDETQYLIDTFRNTVNALRAQERELQRLHALQKSRADDLERVTAALTRSLSSGFLAIDPEGRIVDVNAAAREILRPPAEPQGQRIAAAFGDNEFSEKLAEAFERRAAITRSEASVAGDEGERMIGLTTVPLVSDTQQFLGMIALFTDLTPIRRLEARLRDAQALADLGEMSAGIAHEFRNALSTILGYLKLARRAPLESDVDTKLHNAEEEAVQLSRAVDSLLAFARPMAIERQPVELRALVDSLLTRFRAQHPDVGFLVTGDAVTIDADPVALGRAIDNVVRNAVDAIHQKGVVPGRIEVTLASHPEPSLTIRDNGIGVDPDAVPRLFLPFQSDKPQGVGLGLALAKKIVISHGGSISMVGEPGVGTAVVIRF